MMKRCALLALLLLVLAVFTGCQGKFTRESPYTELTDTADITLAVQEGSRTEGGLTLQIENHTANEYTYGMEYSLEQLREGRWYALGEQQEVTALAAILKPNETNTFFVTWEGKLPKGTYRVVKPIFTDATCNLGVEFTVE